MKLLISALAVGAVVVLAGCSPGSHSRTSTITIANMAYGPAPTGLHVGDTLVWRNADILRHSATARDGSFNLDLAPGASGQVTLKNPGALTVYCRYHPDMTTRIVVEP